MAPAPGSGHSEDNGEIQVPTPTPPAAMSSSQGLHQDEASPTTPPYYTIPYMPSSYTDGVYSTSFKPISTITTDTYGMVIIIVEDGEGNSWRASSQGPYNKDGAHSSTVATPQADLSPTASLYIKTTGSATNNAAATSSSLSGSGFEPQENQEHHGPPFPVILAMSIIIPTIIIVLSLCAFYFLCVRRKRKSHLDQEVPAMVAARRVPEMKDTGVGGGPAMMSTRAVAPASTSGAGVSPLTSPATTSSAGTGTPPVILSTTMNDAYYTGIDTSDHISLTDQRSEASADTFGEEPPPPYRPRSVPPISRETSVRTSMCRDLSVRSSRHDPMSGTNLMRRSVDVRSPFDDPEDSDDDNLSQISTIRSLPRQDTDRLSVVSDMSYQEESMHTHTGV